MADYKNDEAVLVERGVPFKTDMEARSRKMKMNAMKIWKHRASIIWSEFNITIIASLLFAINYLMVISYGVDKIGAIFLCPILMCVEFATGLGLLALYVDFLKHKFDRIKRNWNPY